MPTTNIKAFGTDAAGAPLHSMSIERRALTPYDVEIQILYCGICHSDLHAIRNEWGGARYPMVPGHEIVGKVTKVGSSVTKFKAGDVAGVMDIIDSCRECEYCKEGLEQFCAQDTFAYGSDDKFLGGHTFGGFAETIVVNEHFAMRIPAKMEMASAAPILCAGITVYSPLKHWGAGPGKKVGVIGIGGLGHMAIKIAKAMGAWVVVFTTSSSKAGDAKRFGADEVVITNTTQINSSPKLDIIIDTVSAKHDVNEYLRLLKVDGTLVLVGLPGDDISVGAFPLVVGRKNFSGSNMGGMAETQEVLDFCAEHNITSDIELITVAQINEAFVRLEKGDVKYRFVVDMTSLNK